MKVNSERTSNTIGNILQVTKNTIQLNENFYDYYINKDNALYMKQLPLLVQKTNMQAIAIRKKENEKNYIEIENIPNKSVSLDKGYLNNVRNTQIRSKKLPPLCPFYNHKGELIRTVVNTSKINRKYLIKDQGNLSYKKIKLIKLGEKQKEENVPGLRTIYINFDDFQNDYFNEPEYSSFSYKDSQIFGKKEYYFDIIKNKINEFKTADINDNEFKKEKIFTKNKYKKNISLKFNSISVKIYDLQEEKEKKGNETQVFEYNLPFIYLPLFYFKGEDKFKIFLSKIIQWDNINNKFILNEKQDIIFKDILLNCIDFKNDEEKSEEEKKKAQKGETTRSTKTKYSFTIGKKSFKKELAAFKIGSLNNTIIEEQNLAQTMAGPNPGMYMANFEERQKKLDIISQSNIYPYKKTKNYINYNVFEFLWLTSNKNFKVLINTPLICVDIPTNNIHVKKYIDFELLFYLYERNFLNWDFYLVKYLSSFKSFRFLLEQINSINETTNKNFYLIKPKIKKYLFNNTKIINIATIKQRDILDNLIEGLMEIPEEKKEEEINKEKDKIDIGEGVNKEKDKKKENKEEDEEKENKEEDKEKENKEENKKEEDENKKDENKNEKDNKKDENKNEKEEENLNQIIINENDSLVNCTFVEKCFIAIIRFVDTKTYKANEYKIYFNFNHFQKFERMEKYIDKISFLIKFINIYYFKKTVTMDYKSLDSFNENEWIKDYNKYNGKYLNIPDNKLKKTLDYHRNNAEFIGMLKNSVIQMEIHTPLSLARILNDSGTIKTEKIFMNINYQEKSMNIEKDNILEISKIFYDCYEEEQYAKK